MTASIDERITAGVAWLDANVPDWLDRIDLDRLDLASTCDCLLGQTFAHVAEQMGHSDPWTELDGWTVVMATRVAEVPHISYGDSRALGFNGLYGIWAESDDIDREFADLTDAWCSRITALRAERQAVAR